MLHPGKVRCSSAHDQALSPTRSSSTIAQGPFIGCESAHESVIWRLDGEERTMGALVNYMHRRRAWRSSRSTTRRSMPTATTMRKEFDARVLEARFDNDVHADRPHRPRRQVLQRRRNINTRPARRTQRSNTTSPPRERRPITCAFEQPPKLSHRGHQRTLRRRRPRDRARRATCASRARATSSPTSPRSRAGRLRRRYRRHAALRAPRRQVARDRADGRGRKDERPAGGRPRRRQQGLAAESKPTTSGPNGHRLRPQASSCRAAQR